MNTVYLLLGSNLGDRLEFIERSHRRIVQDIGHVVQKSSIYETASWGVEDQDAFLNQALCVQSPLSASTILRKLHRIESDLARVRNRPWGPRTIDIDILLYNDEVIVEEGLIIPHKLMHKRQFALVPMVEIAAELIHPVLHRSMSALLDACTDDLAVNKISLEDV